MKRKWQRVLSWILTLTMLISTFQGTGFTVKAASGDVVAMQNTTEAALIAEGSGEGTEAAPILFSIERGAAASIIAFHASVEGIANPNDVNWSLEERTADGWGDPVMAGTHTADWSQVWNANVTDGDLLDVYSYFRITASRENETSVTKYFNVKVARKAADDKVTGVTCNDGTLSEKTFTFTKVANTAWDANIVFTATKADGGIFSSDVQWGWFASADATEPTALVTDGDTTAADYGFGAATLANATLTFAAGTLTESGTLYLGAKASQDAAWKVYTLSFDATEPLTDVTIDGRATEGYYAPIVDDTKDGSSEEDAWVVTSPSNTDINVDLTAICADDDAHPAVEMTIEGIAENYLVQDETDKWIYHLQGAVAVANTYNLVITADDGASPAVKKYIKLVITDSKVNNIQLAGGDGTGTAADPYVYGIEKGIGYTKTITAQPGTAVDADVEWTFEEVEINDGEVSVVKTMDVEGDDADVVIEGVTLKDTDATSTLIWKLTGTPEASFTAATDYKSPVYRVTVSDGVNPSVAKYFQFESTLTVDEINDILAYAGDDTALAEPIEEKTGSKDSWGYFDPATDELYLNLSSGDIYGDHAGLIFAGVNGNNVLVGNASWAVNVWGGEDVNKSILTNGATWNGIKFTVVKVEGGKFVPSTDGKGYLLISGKCTKEFTNARIRLTATTGDGSNTYDITLNSSRSRMGIVALTDDSVANTNTTKWASKDDDAANAWNVASPIAIGNAAQEDGIFNIEGSADLNIQVGEGPLTGITFKAFQTNTSSEPVHNGNEVGDKKENNTYKDVKWYLLEMDPAHEFDDIHEDEYRKIKYSNATSTTIGTAPVFVKSRIDENGTLVGLSFVKNANGTVSIYGEPVKPYINYTVGEKEGINNDNREFSYYLVAENLNTVGENPTEAERYAYFKLDLNVKEMTKFDTVQLQNLENEETSFVQKSADLNRFLYNSNNSNELYTQFVETTDGHIVLSYWVGSVRKLVAYDETEEAFYKVEFNAENGKYIEGEEDENVDEDALEIYGDEFVEIVFQDAEGGYSVADRNGREFVKPISVKLLNRHMNRDLTNVEVYLSNLEYEKDFNYLGIYNVSDKDKFVLKYNGAVVDKISLDKLTKGGYEQGQEFFTVEPIEGLDARYDKNGNIRAYEAAVMVKADELYPDGIVLGYVSFMVQSGWKVSKDGKTAEFLRNDVLPAGLQNEKVFDLGTYQAGMNLPNIGIKVESTGGNTFWEAVAKGGVKNENLPGTKLVVNGHNTNTLTLSGALSYDAWADDTATETVDGVKYVDYVDTDNDAIFAYDPQTGNTVWYIPFLAKNAKNDTETFYGKMTVKPAALDMEFKDSPKNTPVVLNDENEFTYKWVENKKAEGTYTKELFFTNVNDTDIKIKVAAPDTNTFVVAWDGLASFDITDTTKNEVSIPAGATAKLTLTADGTFYSADGKNIVITVDGAAVVRTVKPAVLQEEAITQKMYGFATKTITVNYNTYDASKGLKIVAPVVEDPQAPGHPHSTMGNPHVEDIDEHAFYAELGVKTSWQFRINGGDANEISRYTIVNAGDPIADLNSPDGNKVPLPADLGITNFVDERGGGLAEYGFNINGTTGELSGTPKKLGTFVICVSITKGSGKVNSNYTYLQITVGPYKGMTVKDGNKVVKAEGVETLPATKYADVSNDRNVFHTTTDINRQSTNYELIISSNAATTIHGLKASIVNATENADGVFAGAVYYKNDALIGNEANPFKGLSVQGTVPAEGVRIGDIASNGSARLYVNIDAIELAGVTAGEYKMVVKLYSDPANDGDDADDAEMEPQYFAVKLTVDATPKIYGFNGNEIGTMGWQTNSDWHSKAKIDEIAYKLYRPESTTAPEFNPTEKNVLMGDKVALGKEIKLSDNVKFVTMWDDANKLVDPRYLKYTWSVTTPGDPEPAGLELTDEGVIKGTPTALGYYYMTVYVEDTTDINATKIGCKDICIVVPGSVTVAVEVDGEDVYTASALDDDNRFTVFDGSVAGDTGMKAKTFTIKNREASKDITGLNVTIRDDQSDPKWAGGKDHFKAVLESTSIAAGKGNVTTFTVAPVNADKAGMYRAIVVVSGEKLAPIEFPVYWNVAEKLTVTAPSLDETKGVVGEGFSVTFKASGAGIAYDNNGKLLDEMIYDDAEIAGENNNSTQNVDWYIALNENDMDNERLAKMVVDLAQLGLDSTVAGNARNNAGARVGRLFDKSNLVGGAQPSTIASVTAQITDDHTYALANVLGKSTVNTLKAYAALLGAGNYTFTVKAKVPAVTAKTDKTDEVVLWPEQNEEFIVSIVISKNSDVFVKAYNLDPNKAVLYYGVDPVDHNGSAGEEKVEVHLDANDEIIPPYMKMSNYTFRPATEGYKNTVEASDPDRYNRAFTVLSAMISEEPLTVSANLVEEDGSTTTEFEFRQEGNGAYNPVTGLNYKAGETSIVVQSNVAWEAASKVNVQPKENLEAGIHTAILRISGTGIEDINIPLSFTVEDADYSVSFTGGYDKDVANPLKWSALKDDTFTLPAVKAVATGDDGATDVLGYLKLYATGNKDIVVDEIVELRADNSQYGVNEESLWKLQIGNAAGKWLGADGGLEYHDWVAGNANLVPYVDQEVKRAADVTAPQVDKDDYTLIPIRIASKKTVSDNSVKLRIFFENGEDAGERAFKDVTINYVVYSDVSNIDITPEEDKDMGTTAEGYDNKSFVVGYKVDNKNTGDRTESIHNLVVEIDKSDFILSDANGKRAKVVEREGVRYWQLEVMEVKPGETVLFNVTPIQYLPQGDYEYHLRFFASNMAEVKRNGSFHVTQSDDLVTRAYMNDVVGGNTGYTLNNGFKNRLLDTLNALDQMNPANARTKSKGFAVIKVPAAVANNPYGVDFYLINVNDPSYYMVVDGVQWGEAYNAQHTTNSKFDVVVYSDGDLLKVIKINDDFGFGATRSITNDITGYENTIEFDGYVHEKTFNHITFRMENIVTYDLSSVTGEGANIIIDGESYGDYNSVKYQTNWPPFIHMFVPYGKTVDQAVEGYHTIEVEIKDKISEGFQSNNDNHDKIATNAPEIKKEYNLTTMSEVIPVWHEHEYATDPVSKVVPEYDADGKATKGVSWNWVGDEATGYTQATVTITCIKDGCPDVEASARTLKAILTETSELPTCTKGGHTKYHAVALDVENYTDVQNITRYTSDRIGKVADDGTGHNWVFDWDSFTWIYENPEEEIEEKKIPIGAVVYKTCQNTHHLPELDGDKTVSVNGTVTVSSDAADCIHTGKRVYTATFEGTDVVMTKTVTGVMGSVHTIVEDPVWDWEQEDYTGDFTTATATFKCSLSENHVFSKMDNQPVATPYGEGKTKRVATVTIENLVNGTVSQCTYTSTVFTMKDENGKDVRTDDSDDSHEHTWSEPVWSWTGTPSENNVAAKATFNCTTPGFEHVVSYNAAVAEKSKSSDGKLVTYVATVKHEEKEYTNERTFDTESGQDVTHETHTWKFVPYSELVDGAKTKFNWAGTNSQNGVAKATYRCLSGNELSEVAATVTRSETQSGKIVYKAVVEANVSLDGKKYTESITVTTGDNGETIIVPGGGEGIGIEGLEEEYPYTGAAIKPVFVVMDYDRDVQLAQGTDYTVKYKNNKKVGTATITIKGKGNYQGDGVTATFEIKAPAEYCGLEADQLVAGVKKIDKINFKPVYTGEAQYPETLTVTAKDKSVLTMTHEGDGVYTTEADKTVAITITNNINKGTATVAATGADGKTKKKSFKITAANLPTEGFEAAEAVFAVKGAKPAVITGEFNGKTIVLGQDFTIKKVNNNKAAGEGNVIIKGKGNFAPKSTATVNFEIAPIELSEENVAFNAAPKAKVSSKLVTIGDGNGAKIPAKMITVEGASGKLAAGQEIEVTIKGDGTNITGEVTMSIKVGAAKKAKATVQKGYQVEWTGELINLEELESNPFETGVVGLKGLTYGEDYVVAGYLYSNKKGKMGVVLQGISEKFTGVTVAKVKVAAKTMKKAEQ